MNPTDKYEQIKDIKRLNPVELEAMVLKHDQQIKDLAAHLLELKQLVTPMMEFKPGMTTTMGMEYAANFESAEKMLEKKEWVYLTEQDVATIKKNAITMEWAILMADTTAKEKNT